MTRFYRHLATGLFIRTALHRAKLDPLAAAGTAQTDPYVWAAFGAVGYAGARAVESGSDRPRSNVVESTPYSPMAELRQLGFNVVEWGLTMRLAGHVGPAMDGTENRWTRPMRRPPDSGP